MISNEKVIEELATRVCLFLVEKHGIPVGVSILREAFQPLPDLLLAARAEGMEEAELAVYRLKMPDADPEWNRALQVGADAIRRISSLKPKTTDEAKP